MLAITRRVSPSLASCELTFQQHAPIDVALAMRQHADYEQALCELGVFVTSLPALEDQPDCVFVEDPAVVLDEVAVITRMGAEARRGETQSLAEALKAHRKLAWMSAPATLDGGDVVVIDREILIGRSQRTNDEGVRQFQTLVQEYGYRVSAIPVSGCLHLKSACCRLDDKTLLLNRAWLSGPIENGPLARYRIIEVDGNEPAAADVLAVGGVILMPDSFPKTRARIEAAGYSVETVDVSELRKAEAGVTCMSLIFNPDVRPVPEPEGSRL